MSEPFPDAPAAQPSAARPGPPAPAAPAPRGHGHVNRLARAASPYLLQHAHNPVDWYPWGPEALDRARREERPILLSIGYSACHWCHVMEHESFEDEATAAVMNRLFVCIKVDREERPDLDHTYQLALQLLGGQGGWPLTMFLTPDLRPFFGGTYFPPRPRFGMPAFVQLLEAVADTWRNRRADVEKQAQGLTGLLDEVQRPRAPGPVDARLLDGAVESMLDNWDPVHGGFGRRPKFPNSLALEFLLRRGVRPASQGGDPAWTDRVLVALSRMAGGGIFDQLGGGYHRYSVDERWLVPHFEKMLYDNALLLALHAQAWQVSRDPEHARVCRAIAAWMLRDLRHPEGGFFSTLDADSEGGEGAFYTWTPDELAQVLGERDAALAARLWGVVPGGNFEHGRSILHRATDPETAARQEGRPVADALRILDEGRRRLLEVRDLRPRPGLDDKVIAGWNGLALRAFALAGTALGEPSWIEAASACSDFIERRLQHGEELARTWRDGSRGPPACADDHAFLAEGELALFEATGDPRHFHRARTFALRTLERFDAGEGDLFLAPPDAGPAPSRARAGWDDSVPSAISSLAHVLVRLHALDGDGRHAEAADRLLRARAGELAAQPQAWPRLLSALDAAVHGAATLVVTGAPGNATREALLRAARERLLPDLVIVPAPGKPDEALSGLLAGKPPDAAAAWLCRGASCSPPARTPEQLAALLSSR